MRRAARVVAVLLAALPVFAWHPAGHKILAAIAYDSLDRRTRAKVDELIRRHPDYGRFVEGARGGGRETARRAFINASAWADDIKGDERFYDDTRANAKATPALPGYPDMKRHTNWHYVNIYFSPDGTPFPATPEPNALTELPRMTAALAKGDAEASYLLVWFLHVAGDVHQPMHCVSRYTKHNKDRNGRPVSDLGGNLVMVDGYTNLHAVWDALLGVQDDAAYIDWMARRLRREFRRPREVSTDPAVWTSEGFELAKKEAYQMPASVGTRENQFRTTPAYMRNALAVAHRQAALGGYRMAAALEKALGGGR
jgi:hypothetical protein